MYFVHHEGREIESSFVGIGDVHFEFGSNGDGIASADESIFFGAKICKVVLPQSCHNERH